MAKQIVNTGLADNDGTGDPLRNAFTKVNENFTELYNAESFSGSYADLSNKPTSITAFGITDGSNNQILSTDGAGNFTFVNSSASVDLDTELDVASATNNQVLSWTGTEFDWVDNSGAGLSNNAIINLVTSADLDMSGNKVLFGNVYDALVDLPNASSYHGMFAHVHATGKGYFAHAGAWVELANASDIPDGGGGGASNFSDLGDATFAGLTLDKVYEPAIAMLRLDNVGTTAYTFNSHYAGNNPTILVLSGATIAFDLDEIPGHPFQIQDSAGDPYNVGLVHVSAAGIVTTGLAAQNRSSGTLYWRVPESIFGTYRYQCNSHAAMFGPITIKRLSSI